jgi:hypothetical protein
MMAESPMRGELPEELLARVDELVLPAGTRQSVAGAERQRAALVELLLEARRDSAEKASSFREAYDRANESASKQYDATQKEKKEKAEILAQVTMLLNAVLKSAWMLQCYFQVSPMDKVVFESGRLTIALDSVLAKLIIRTAETMEVRRRDGDAQSATVHLDENGVVFTEELFLMAFLGIPLERDRLIGSGSLLPEEEEGATQSTTSPSSELLSPPPVTLSTLVVVVKLLREMGHDIYPIALVEFLTGRRQRLGNRPAEGPRQN